MLRSIFVFLLRMFVLLFGISSLAQTTPPPPNPPPPGLPIDGFIGLATLFAITYGVYMSLRGERNERRGNLKNNNTNNPKNNIL